MAGVNDVPSILDLYRGLSAESLMLRFSGPVTDALLRSAAAIDPSTDHVVVAVDGGRVCGEARLRREVDATHEVALTVADDTQGRGVGAALLERLRADAVELGVVTLRASVRLDNRPMLALLRRVGGALVRATDGEVVFDLAADGQMPTWPAATTARRVLVEAPGSREHPVTTALREAGQAVRQCSGPGRGRRDPCPLLAAGHCRLADEADVIICLLPQTDPAGVQVAAAHATDRPERLGNP